MSGWSFSTWYSRKAAQVAALYGAFAGLWIFASDRLLNLALDDPALLLRISMGKGFAFVFVTTLLLYLLLRNWESIAGGESMPPPKPRKLVILFVCLALLVPGIGFSIVRLHGPHMREAAFDDLRAVASLKVGQIVAWLQERQGDAEVLASSEGLAAQAARLAESGDTAAHAYIERRLRSAIKAWGFNAALLVTGEGRVLVSAGERGEIPAELRDTLLSAALADGQIRRSELYRDADGTVHLDFVVPLHGAGARPGLAVVLHTPVEAALFEHIRSWPTPSPSAESLLVRRVGEEVLFLNTLRHRDGAALSLRLPLTDPRIPAVAAVLSDQPQTMEGYDYRGVAVLAATAPVPGSDWRLIAKIDRDEVLAHLDHLVFWVSLVAFAAVSAVAATILLLWRQTLRAHQLELRYQAASIRREGEDRYRRLHESMRDAFAMVDMSGRLIDFNQAFRDMLGYGEEALRRLTYAELTPQKWHDREARIIAEQVIAQGQSQVYEKEYRRADGTVFPVELRTSLMCDENGQAEAMWAIVRDISERKQAEAAIHRLNVELEQKVAERTAELRAAVAELETFSYSVSHDLKAPLRGIDGYSRLLEEDHGAALNEEGRTFVANIRAGARQMGQLIEDLLAYSRIERRALSSTRLVPAQVAQAVAKEFAGDLAAHTIELNLAVPDCEAQADLESLAIILRNLLDNAIKFCRTAPAPTIEIAGRLENDKLLLWVRDNGIGFDMRFHERIFEIFQRLQRAEEYPGTGIGLAIVRKAAQRMAVRVWAESEPGQGATFFVELPR